MIYITSYILISIFLLLVYSKKTKTIKGKKQVSILLTSLLITFIFGTFEEIILPVISSYKSPGPAPTFFIILMSGIFYSIIRYRFLSITPELVSGEIISNIDESLILLDKDFNIITINKSTENLLNYSKNDIRLIELSKIILEYNALIKEIKNLLQGIHKDFSARINYINKEGIQIFVETKISIIKDKFEDMIGIMIIGKEVKELKQFKTIYKITDRQAEVVQDIISGKTNKEIAERMGIAETTIKGHITGIYDKLGVNNKIQLFNLLKDFNLIPESRAEKTVLLLKKR